MQYNKKACEFDVDRPMKNLKMIAIQDVILVSTINLATTKLYDNTQIF